MAAPVVRQAAEAFPDVQFTMVSRPFLQPFFEGVPNLQFVGINLDKDYRGLKGIWKLFRTLRALQPSCVADIHDVLRTKILRLFFRLYGIRVYKINKGRKEKRALTRGKNKILQPLKTSFERYHEVLEKCVGTTFSADTAFTIPHYANTIDLENKKAIGIAPFAKHEGKIYPLRKMEDVVAHFSAANVPVFLFGAGNEERAILEMWEQRYPNVQSTIGKIGNLSGELALIQQLSVMISMDSANMHFASFLGIPVVSVWGATHPYAGFYGWRQSLENIVCIELSCRPCSVYGNKECARNDYFCLNEISPVAIIEKVEKLLK